MKLRNLIALLWLTGGILPAALWSQPKFSIIGGNEFKFGEVYTGKSVGHNFIIKNSGNDTLIISDVSASCGCTGTLMSNSHIAPNDTGVLSISFDSKRFTGDIAKTVSLNTNDTAHSHVRVSFTANVVKAFNVDPEYIMFHANLDSIATDEITVKNTSTLPVRILSITSSSADIVTAKSSLEILKPEEEAVITCTLRPKVGGTLKGTITIKTDHPKIPELDVRFFGLVSNKTSHSSSTIHN